MRVPNELVMSVDVGRGTDCPIQALIRSDDQHLLRCQQPPKTDSKGLQLGNLSQRRRTQETRVISESVSTLTQKNRSLPRSNRRDDEMPVVA